MQFDSYIQNRIQSFMADCTKEGMEPSDDFSNKVMESCICAERSRAKKLNIALILLSLSPFIGRQFWMLIRGDHFSVMHWPFGKIICSAYGMIINSVGFYTLLTAGLLIALFIYIKKFRHIESSTIKIS